MTHKRDLFAAERLIRVEARKNVAILLLDDDAYAATLALTTEHLLGEHGFHSQTIVMRSSDGRCTTCANPGIDPQPQGSTAGSSLGLREALAQLEGTRGRMNVCITLGMLRPAALKSCGHGHEHGQSPKRQRRAEGDTGGPEAWPPCRADDVEAISAVAADACAAGGMLVNVGTDLRGSGTDDQHCGGAPTGVGAVQALTDILAAACNRGGACRVHTITVPTGKACCSSQAGTRGLVKHAGHGVDDVLNDMPMGVGDVARVIVSVVASTTSTLLNGQVFVLK